MNAVAAVNDDPESDNQWHAWRGIKSVLSILGAENLRQKATSNTLITNKQPNIQKIEIRQNKNSDWKGKIKSRKKNKKADLRDRNGKYARFLAIRVLPWRPRTPYSVPVRRGKMRRHLAARVLSPLWLVDRPHLVFLGQRLWLVPTARAPVTLWPGWMEGWISNWYDSVGFKYGVRIFRDGNQRTR